MEKKREKADKERENKKNNKIQEVKPMEVIQEEHKYILDEYFINGFNGVKAVQRSRPELNTHAANMVFQGISKAPASQEYILKKRHELRQAVNIEQEMILRELIQFAYSDATEYIGLTIEQVRELPNEIKRCIQSIKHRKKSYKDRQGQEVTEEVLEVRIVDKIKAIEMINKHIGFYSEDNKQKQIKVDISQLNVDTLNAIVNAAIPGKD